MRLAPSIALLFVCLSLGPASCGDPPGEPPPVAEDPQDERCGPASGVVAKVIDGDTVVLESGEKLRYLMVDTPEITNGKDECYGREASDFNAEYVLGQTIEITYDVECEDSYGRLLAYVDAPDGEINTLLVARGYACFLNIPPNGEDRAAEFSAMQEAARDQGAGLWGVCSGACGQ